LWSQKIGEKPIWLLSKQTSFNNNNSIKWTDKIDLNGWVSIHNKNFICLEEKKVKKLRSWIIKQKLTSHADIWIRNLNLSHVDTLLEARDAKGRSTNNKSLRV
jgi:hypothetical protein